MIGLLQGITELFPISSLGHSVLVPELLGWHSLVAGQSADESFYLAFLVGLHCATAIGPFCAILLATARTFASSSACAVGTRMREHSASTSGSPRDSCMMCLGH